jgi:hypothetical protein
MGNPTPYRPGLAIVLDPNNKGVGRVVADPASGQVERAAWRAPSLMAFCPVIVPL